ncbi:hypothetical protein CVD25_07850 [Bacillus canaveralius]|uniref:Uncharacterized protein n=1 Tax=Bacillus canaveralius TaxID=1403243 RepID=A0A2N5GS51_9BACI|nr:MULTISPECIES: hypothetical protein [Bacillus]PLR85758.1 hypothetical protein CVD23_07375 [Bacillus sp. V33-4]PLR86390.1 hypothetical protein CU635_02005 [Bacillus canaveralius]PLR98623.1 hypothetical protein CVD25_07850 [Bacillus canaveralius]RSK53939.1 hypothetical protein EJA13_06850 [Bacillus canaveralius]
MLSMFEVLKFLVSFFLILPVVTFIHLSGHIFFVSIFGGTEKKLVIGCGKHLFSFWRIEVRKYYFWNGACEFKSLRYDNRLTNMIIYLGGSIFNFTSIVIVNWLIYSGRLEDSVLWNQFIYFSFYVLFFSLFPMYFSDGSPSDGKAAVLSLKNEHDDKITDDIQIRKDD